MTDKEIEALFKNDDDENIRQNKRIQAADKAPEDYYDTIFEFLCSHNIIN